MRCFGIKSQNIVVKKNEESTIKSPLNATHNKFFQDKFETENKGIKGAK